MPLCYLSPIYLDTRARRGYRLPRACLALSPRPLRGNTRAKLSGLISLVHFAIVAI